MKIRIGQEDLVKAVIACGKLISSRGQLPVLANVLINAEKDGVNVVATNLEMGIRVEAGGKVEEAGAITVPQKNLAEFLGSISGGEIVLEQDKEKLRVKSGKFGAGLATVPAEEFPSFVPAESIFADSDKIELDRKMVSAMANEVAFAAAVDESRPVLTGVKCMLAGEHLVVIATDGFRLSKKKFKIQDANFKEGMILPAKVIIELARLTSENKGSGVEMWMLEGANQVVFRIGKTTLVSRVLEGNFPDVDKIIPIDFKTKVQVNREDLVKAVKAVSIFARENANIVRFKIQEDKILVFTMGSQTGEAEVEIEAECEGDAMEVAFNYKYVLDYLQAVDEENVDLALSGATTAAVWGGQDLLHLIMPIRG